MAKSSGKSQGIPDAQTFLQQLGQSSRWPVYVLIGDQDFLKQECRQAIIEKVLAGSDPSFAVSNYVGNAVEFSEVRNELDTLPFLATSRVVIIEQADDFVSDNRLSLEQYIKQPSKLGVLVLEVKSLPSNTRLARELPDEAKVDVSCPELSELPRWCIQRAKHMLKRELAADAARLLVQRIGQQLGQLVLELQKLAVACPGSTIEVEDVDRLVAKTREENVFEIMNLVGQGQASRALAILRELLATDDPMAILGPITAQLRRLADVERHLQRGQPLGAAMDAAGVTRYPKFRAETEQQLRYLGRKRLEQIPQWLLELDAGLKGGSQLDRALQLERLICRLAAPRS